MNIQEENPVQSEVGYSPAIVSKYAERTVSGTARDPQGRHTPITLFAGTRPCGAARFS